MNKEMIEIHGNAIPTPMKIPDWNQTDETKSDYIKNKPDLDKKQDKTILLTKTKQVANGFVITDTIPVGSEIKITAAGLIPDHSHEFDYRCGDCNDGYADFTTDDQGVGIVSIMVEQDWSDSDIVNIFSGTLSWWDEDEGEYRYLEEPYAVEYTCLENISDAISGHETRLNDISNGFIKGFGVPFDVSGTDLVSINNVHPKEHNVEVTTDANNITVHGKNLFNIDDGLPTTTTSSGYKSLSKNADGTYTMTRTNVDRSSDVVSVDIPSGTQITISADIIEATASAMVFYFTDGNGSNGQEARCTVTNGKYKGTITTKAHMKNARIMLLVTDTAGQYMTFKCVQIEYGPVATEFEPYKGGTYPVTDGKAIVKSVSPTMNIKASGDINAKGYQDGLAVIDELKQAIVSLGGNV